MSEQKDPEFDELNLHVSTMSLEAAQKMKLPGFDLSANSSSVALVISALLSTPDQVPGVVDASGTPLTYEKKGFGVRFILKASQSAVEANAQLGKLAAHGQVQSGQVSVRLEALGLPDALQLAADKAIGDFTGKELVSLRKVFNEQLPDYLEAKDREGLLLSTYAIPGPGLSEEVPHRTLHYAIRQLAEGAEYEEAVRRFPAQDMTNREITREIIRQVYRSYGAPEEGAPPEEAINEAKSWLRAVDLDD